MPPILSAMSLSPLFPHFSPQSYYKPYVHFVNTFGRFFCNFPIISVLRIENRVVLNTKSGIWFSLKAKVTAKLETLFYRRPHGKIWVLEVFVDEFHAY